MPELPDVEVFSSNLNKLFAGKKLVKVKIINGKKLKHKPSAFSKRLVGRKLKCIYRSGKEMRFEFTGGQLLGLHLMLTGDIFVFKKKNHHHSTIAELFFNGTNLALTDRMGNANIKLDPIDKAGVDAISKDLNFKYLKSALQSKATIKKLLTNQDIIRGIGNSYSDEILWEARISPYSISNKIPHEKVKELATVIKNRLKKAITQIAKTHKGKINVEVKEFLRIHTTQKAKSPTGAAIIIDKKGMMKTYYTKEQKLYR